MFSFPSSFTLASLFLFFEILFFLPLLNGEHGKGVLDEHVRGNLHKHKITYRHVLKFDPLSIPSRLLPCPPAVAFVVLD